MSDLVKRLRAHAVMNPQIPSENASRARTCKEAADEIERLTNQLVKARAAISFWRMARYPEVIPDPHDMEGRCARQHALDTAENTLYYLPLTDDQGEK